MHHNEYNIHIPCTAVYNILKTCTKMSTKCTPHAPQGVHMHKTCTWVQNAHTTCTKMSTICTPLALQGTHALKSPEAFNREPRQRSMTKRASVLDFVFGVFLNTLYMCVITNTFDKDQEKSSLIFVGPSGGRTMKSLFHPPLPLQLQVPLLTQKSKSSISNNSDPPTQTYYESLW